MSESIWLKHLWSSDPQTYWLASAEIQQLRLRIAELEKAYDAILDDCRIQEKRIKELERLLQAHQTRGNTPTKPMGGD